MNVYGPFCNACASFERLGTWKYCDLDVILMNGDQLYKSLDRTGYLSVTDLSETFWVGSAQVNVEYNTNKYGTLRNGTVSAEELSEIFISVSDECKRKVHYFLCKVFVLLYFSGFTAYIILIHTAEIQ